MAMFNYLLYDCVLLKYTTFSNNVFLMGGVVFTDGQILFGSITIVIFTAFIFE